MRPPAPGRLRARLLRGYLYVLLLLQPAALVLFSVLAGTSEGEYNAWERHVVERQRALAAAIQSRLDAAATLTVNGEYAEAEASYSRIANDAAGGAEAHLELRVHALDGLAITRAALGDAERAAAAARESIATFSRESAGHRALGRALLATGQADAAETCLRRAVELDPNHLDSVQDLATLFAAQGRWADVVAAFETYLGASCRAHCSVATEPWTIVWGLAPSVDGITRTEELRLSGVAREVSIETVTLELRLPPACDLIELDEVALLRPRDLRDPTGPSVVAFSPATATPGGRGFRVHGDGGRLEVTSTQVRLVIPLTRSFTSDEFDRLSVRLTLHKRVPEGLRALVAQARERGAAGRE